MSVAVVRTSGQYSLEGVYCVSTQATHLSHAPDAYGTWYQPEDYLQGNVP